MKGYTIQEVPSSTHAASEVTVPTPRATRDMTLGRKIKAYIHLTKPQIIELLLVTTAPTMMFAAHGMPSFWLVINTLLGGAMAAGASCAFNCYIDRPRSTRLRMGTCCYLRRISVDYGKSPLWAFRACRYFALCSLLLHVFKEAHYSEYCVGWDCRVYACPNCMGSCSQYH